MIVVISVVALAVIGLAVALVLGGFPRMSVHSPAAVSSAGGRLLPDGEVLSDDVERVRFGVALRGYRMDQVDAVMDRLHTRLAELEAEVADATPQPGRTAGPVGGARRDRPGQPAERGDGGAPVGLVPFPARRDGRPGAAADDDLGGAESEVQERHDRPGGGPAAR